MGYGGTSVWAFGKEAWCNLEGRYTFIVADYTGLSPTELFICNLGIMGTKYLRSTPIDSEVSVKLGETVTLVVEDIAVDPTYPISNTIDPQIRQSAGTELDWVSIVQQTGASDVVIDATKIGLAVGDYQITLEAFDGVSSVGSALKTDTVTIHVTEADPIPEPPSVPDTTST